MINFSRQLSNVSAVVLASTNANATVETPSSGSAVFVACVVANKGRPGVPLLVDKNNWQQVLGKPMHMREGIHAEGLRHIHEAVQGGAGYVVRVMPTDALAPVLTVGGNGPNTITPSTASYSAPLVVGGSDIFAVKLIDGDNQLVRSLSITPADVAAYGANFFSLKLLETGKDGAEYALEEHIVSFSLEAVGVDGHSAFIEDKITASSSRMQLKANVANLNKFASIAKTAFAGGTSGTNTLVDAPAYQAAIDVLRNSMVRWTHVLAAGCYIDAALQALKQLANDSVSELLFDIEPNISYSAAITRQSALAISSEFAVCYHIPYSYPEPFYGTRVNVGLSGFAFAAKAAGVANNPSVGGWHYSPAGETRGTIPRSGLMINANAGTPDYELMYKSRINKLGLNGAGSLMIDDALTCRSKEDYLRFEWIVATDAAIGRLFIDLANTLKHEPEGLTIEGLTRGMQRILSAFVAAGALVTPQDPADGTEPWKLVVEKVSADLFSVRWDICIAGSARRITGQSRLIK
jgi:hypothetical protein